MTRVVAVLAASKRSSAAAAAHVSIEYRGGSIYWPKARAAVGAGGVHLNKREGDRATPTGTFSLPNGMYRRDRH
jgi:L,D-peptidoglycan transpeptidase YkuD (ErfK/YbiS/YcfS/YnhG family)